MVRPATPCASPTTTATPGERLRRRLERPEPLVLPGCTDALVARIAESVGYDAVYATGAGIANTMLGRPDVGLTTMTEAAEQVADATLDEVYDRIGLLRRR